MQGLKEGVVEEWGREMKGNVVGKGSETSVHLCLLVGRYLVHDVQDVPSVGLLDKDCAAAELPREGGWEGPVILVREDHGDAANKSSLEDTARPCRLSTWTQTESRTCHVLDCVLDGFSHAQRVLGCLVAILLHDKRDSLDHTARLPVKRLLERKPHLAIFQRARKVQERFATRGLLCNGARLLRERKRKGGGW